MALGHSHHHHPSASDDLAEAPLDAANQSLADALRASFKILKLIMFILVVMYCFSGVQCIEEHEQAVVLRFGKLLPAVREPGLSWAFPYPVDETLRFPTKKSNTFHIKSHWPHVKEGQEAEPLDKVRGAGGLKPGLDGSLLTSDRGIVHIQWVVTYRVDDLRRYVLYVADEKTEDVEGLLTALLENAAIRIVSRHSAEAVTRGKTNEIATAVRAEINGQLEALSTGVTVVVLDIPRSSVPGQTISAFDDVTRAENEKQKAIRDAEQKMSNILNQAAGAAYEDLLALLDERDLAEAENNATETAGRDEEIDDLLESRAGGNAGRDVRRAKGFYTQVVQQVQGDVEQYHAALDEFLESRNLFVHRMWEQTRQRILQSKEVKKHILPERVNEIRIHVGPDPEQRRIDEQEALEKEAERYDFEPPKKLHAIVPE